MYFKKVGFPQIIPDNEETYMKYLEGMVESIDCDASIQITKAITALHIRIAPSVPNNINQIVESLNRVHNRLGLRLTYAKSMKSSSAINFSLEIL